ncbi:MAG: DUF3553 domain-containing protein [Phycisphaerae bacterium]|nr:DUF3553 domain-containing protein [Phycisphaerae bacterium]
MTTRDWKLGQLVVHAGKPEWGVGEIRSAQAAVEDGKSCQRLVVRFERAGVKTLSTAYADLRAPDDAIPARDQFAKAPASADSPFAELEKPDLAALMSALPEAATDPFKPKAARLAATLALYRFSSTGASLLDWAAAQTGLSDPLTRFSRHELEQLFDRFRVNLDGHLRQLAFELRREDAPALARALAAAAPPAQQALRRLGVGR